MLLQLSINNIILIDKVNLNFERGFSVFTGETGAGKSIILDSLSFALGARGTSDYVRKGAEKGEVIACFDISELQEVQNKLAENGIDVEDIVVFKRIQNVNGKSRGFINDIPVSLSYMQEVGRLLVEFHGQHDDRDLVQKSTHLRLLDLSGSFSELKEQVAKSYVALRDAKLDLDNAYETLEQVNKDKDYLLTALDELESLNVQPGEEDELSAIRTKMMKHQKLATELKDIKSLLDDSNSPGYKLSEIWRKLDRSVNQLTDKIQPIIDSLDKVLDFLAIVEDSIKEILRDIDFNQNELNDVEERLFALRAASRKYKLPIDDLPNLKEQITEKLALIDNSEEEIARLEKQLTQANKHYIDVSKLLTEKRNQAAKILQQKVQDQLPDLKLEHAKFFIKITSDINQMSANGIDDAEFWVQTNPNTSMGPLMKIASGGELSRFLLALKVALFDKGAAKTLIFDEIDTGVSGAVATAIGKKLKILGENAQLLSITHLPQVAALADSHYFISKDAEHLSSNVVKLTKDMCVEEIARMLSGSEITLQARASAISLLESR